MAKDPAVLFYTADFLIGVQSLTMEERGQYITLLCVQHQQGHLTEKIVRLSVGTLSPDVKAKFSVDENGLLYHPRMEEETNKRRAYSESRHANGSKGGRPSLKKHMDNHMDKHMDNHMGNENENIDVITNVSNSSKVVSNKYTTKKKAFIPPTLDEVLEFAREKDRTDIAKEFFEYFDTGQWVDSKGDKVKSWKQKFLTWCSRNPKKPEVEKPKYDNSSVILF